ncbi:MAG: hypothetical protein AB1439_00525 [candidate division FCPU426 bacterium]
MASFKRCGNCGRVVPLSTRIGDKCPHCGLRFDFERRTESLRSKPDLSFFWIFVAVAFLVGATIVPRMANSYRKKELAVAAQLRSGDPAERLQAAVWLKGKAPAVLERLAPDFAAALGASQGRAKTELISTLLPFLKARIRRASPGVLLLPAPVAAEVRNAATDPDPDVRRAAGEILSLMEQTPNPAPSIPARRLK